MINANGNIYKNKISWSGTYNYFNINFDKNGYYPFEYFHGEGSGGQIADVRWITPDIQSNPNNFSSSYAVTMPSNVFFVKRA